MKEIAENIPLSLKYNRALPKMKEIVMKHWHLLHINPNLAEIFRTPCLANNETLCCKKVVHTTMFRSSQTNRIFRIYHSLNCKSKYVIYLLECTKCKIQYVKKAETGFNIRLNNHRKDVWKPNAIPARCHFSG